jgi:imidazole glycerol phosphate synthase glutamine amidotransferase subunit
MRVTLIDYGAGNATSVERAFNRLGVESIRTSAAECIANAEALVLPGVGHFAALMRSINERSLRAPLLDALARGVPFLGICLGLQALYKTSDEAPQLQGLGVLPGNVRALPSNVKLPHMGWNQLAPKRASRLLQGIDSHAYFYFAHSYAAAHSKENEEIAATCSHGSEFIAVLERENLFAVQFHPEKSGTAGAQLLQNFLSLAV